MFYSEALVLDPGNPWLWYNCSLAIPEMSGKENIGKGIILAIRFCLRALNHMEFGVARYSLNQLKSYLEKSVGEKVNDL